MTPRPTTSATIGGRPGDHLLALYANLDLGSFPLGWKLYGEAPTTEADVLLLHALASCLRVPFATIDIRDTPHDTLTFISPKGVVGGQVVSTVAIFASASDAEAAFIARASAASCDVLADQHTAAAIGSNRGVALTSVPLSTAPVGEGTSAFRITETVYGHTVAQEDYFFAVRGPAYMSLDAVPAPVIGVTFEQGLLRALISRLKTLNVGR